MHKESLEKHLPQSERIDTLVSQEVDVSQLKENPDLGRQIKVFLSIKGNDQSTRSNRNNKRLRAGQTFFGGTENRPQSSGGVAIFDLSIDQIPSFESLDWLLPNLSEAYQVTKQGQFFVVVEDDKVILLDQNDMKERHTFKSIWFKNLHTAQLSFDENGSPKTILVSSSGIDSVVELEVTNLSEPLKFWSAYNMIGSKTASGRQIKIVKTNLVETLQDGTQTSMPIAELPPFGLQTGARVLNINGVLRYKNKIYTTSFHQGSIGVISNMNLIDSYAPEITGLGHPHSLYIDQESGQVSSVVSTSKGIWFNRGPSGLVAFDFTKIAGKSEDHQKMEWLQTATLLKEGIWAVVDVNRRSVILIKPDMNNAAESEIRTIKYDPELVIQAANIAE